MLRRHGPLALVLGVALVLRVRGLTEWWLNPDEGIYYSILTRGNWTAFWSELMGNAHPPLYYLILRGLGVFSWNHVWFRSFSVVCGLAAVLGAWAVGRELGGAGRAGGAAGALAGLVVAVSPGAIAMSQVMRPYMLQLALLSGALFFLLRHLRLGSRRDLAGYTTLLVLALLTHYSSVLALAVLLLIVAQEGISRSWPRSEWTRLGAWHVLPVGVALATFALHVRQLADTPLVDEALNGWLSPYMFDSLASAWLGYVGYHGLVAGGGAHAAVALLLLASLGVAVALRQPKPALIGIGALAVGAAAAALGVYPFGGIRHSVWMIAFTVPPLAWFGGWLVTLPPRSAALWAAGTAALLAAGGPVGALLRADRAPRPPSEQVLRREHLASMVDLLDPAGEPRLIVMSAETFYLLLPFYAREREEAVFTADSTLFHFPYGSRRILVDWAWLFDDPLHVSRSLERATASFSDFTLEDREQGVLIFGAWHVHLVGGFAALSGAEPVVLGQRNVPGLVAYLIDLGALRRASGGARPTGLPPA